ncbi:MAG: hypothetical protein V7L31_18165 [Nostoc sp.]|uniref:hypothetical protein n=1 Tax=Nostoc sp. TaxID=1180 RepID=UPI002FF3F139
MTLPSGSVTLARRSLFLTFDDILDFIPNFSKLHNVFSRDVTLNPNINSAPIFCLFSGFTKVA